MNSVTYRGWCESIEWPVLRRRIRELLERKSLEVAEERVDWGYVDCTSWLSFFFLAAAEADTKEEEGKTMWLERLKVFDVVTSTFVRILHLFILFLPRFLLMPRGTLYITATGDAITNHLHQVPATEDQPFGKCPSFTLLYLFSFILYSYSLVLFLRHDTTHFTLTLLFLYSSYTAFFPLSTFNSIRNYSKVFA